MTYTLRKFVGTLLLIFTIGLISLNTLVGKITDGILSIFS